MMLCYIPLMKYIDDGVRFDPVDVARIKPDLYRLIHQGHHTSRAHYEKGELLGCNVIHGEELNMRWRNPIQDIAVL